MNKCRALLLLLLAAVSTLCFADDESEIERTRTVVPLGKIELIPDVQNKTCKATLNIEYYQKATHVHVESTLKNEQCAESSGSYVLRVRYLPDEGAMNTIEFKETWIRTDDTDVVTEKDYYVGEDLEIRRVSSFGLKCECTEPQSVELSSDGETPRHEKRE